MCAPDLLFPRGEEYGSEIKMQGKDKGRRSQREENGWARREDVPRLRKYERRSRDTARQVVEKVEGVVETVAEMRKERLQPQQWRRASRSWPLETRLLKQVCFSGTRLTLEMLEKAAAF